MLHLQFENPEPGTFKIFVQVDVGQITPALYQNLKCHIAGAMGEVGLFHNFENRGIYR